MMIDLVVVGLAIVAIFFEFSLRDDAFGIKSIDRCFG